MHVRVLMLCSTFELILTKIGFLNNFQNAMYCIVVCRSSACACYLAH